MTSLGLLVLLTFSNASAQDTSCEDLYLQDFAALRVAVVTVDRASFRNVQGKPKGPYVIKGDRVVQGPPVNGRRCTYFFGARKPVSGFLNETQATAVPTLPPTPGQYVRDEDARLMLGPGLRIRGDAVWPTPGDSVNVGSLEGQLVRRGPGWAYASLESDDSCQVNVLSLGSLLLLVKDNLECGGLNVTFDGLYRRAR